MVEKLKSRYRFGEPAQSLQVAAIVAGFVLVFILLSQIALIQLYSPGFYVLVAVSFAAVSFVMPAIGTVLLQQLPRKVKSTWKLWQEVCALLLNFSLVAAGNLLLAKVLFSPSMNAILVIAVWLVTIIVGSIPLSVVLFHRQKKELSEKLALASSINDSRKPVRATNAVVCAESAGNYLHLRYENGKSQKIRATMKHWLEDEGRAAGLRRVHSGFAISLPHVVAARGNVQGFFLELADPLPEVPVSRRYIPEVRKMMTNIPQR